MNLIEFVFYDLYLGQFWSALVNFDKNVVKLYKNFIPSLKSFLTHFFD